MGKKLPIFSLRFCIALYLTSSVFLSSSKLSEGEKLENVVNLHDRESIRFAVDPFSFNFVCGLSTPIRPLFRFVIRSLRSKP